MSNKNLFKEAIADAKAVREAALANAKAALEEALTPKLQSMLAAKLNEMEYEEEAMGEEEEMEEGFTTSHGDDYDENLDFNLEEEMEDESMDEDFDLSEILAELDEEEISEPYTDEKPFEDIAGTEKGYVKEAKEKDEEEEDEEESEDVADMSVEDLKALIKDIVTQEIEAEEAEGPEAEAEEEAGEEPMDMGSEAPESDEINLDELLAELDALGEGDDDDEMEEGILGKIGGAIKTGAQKASQSLGMSNPPECDQRGKEIMTLAKSKGITDPGNLDKLKWMAINECRKEKGLSPLVSHVQGRAFGATAEAKEKEEMKEAVDTINTLRNELNEVNLLNAKLLYVNKIFKSKNLSESQKLKVIASFDKATTAKEAKVVFESLSANLTATPKQAIKESYGFASRAAGNAPRKAIVETNDAITRMQKLANIIK
jgi:hypothetical protein